MKIDIHEWPLPTNELEAKAAVFEIDVPEVIWIWREITYEMLVDVFTPTFEIPKGPVDKYTLHGFSGLRNWLKCPTGRLQLASPQVSGSISIQIVDAVFLNLQVTFETRIPRSDSR
jgi:hypothetical protein